MSTTELNKVLCGFFKSDCFKSIVACSDTEDQKVMAITRQVFGKLAEFFTVKIAEFKNLPSLMENDPWMMELCQKAARRSSFDDHFAKQAVDVLFRIILDNIEEIEESALPVVALTCVNINPVLTAKNIHAFGLKDPTENALTCCSLAHELQSPSVLVDSRLESKIGNQTLVYGFSVCKYSEIKKLLDTSLFPYGCDRLQYDNSEQAFRARWLSRVNGTIPQIKTFSYDISFSVPGITLQKREIKIWDKLNKSFLGKQICKQVLTSIVLHSVFFPDDKISVVFCVRLTKKEGEKIAPSMSEQKKYPVTTSELKRMHKLCHDPEIPFVVRKTAQQMVTFVNVIESDSKDRYILTEAQSPWDDPEWIKSLEKKGTRKPTPSWIEEVKSICQKNMSIMSATQTI
jgi:hypothetical protein